MPAPANLPRDALDAWHTEGLLVIEDALDHRQSASFQRWAEAISRPPTADQRRLQYFERIDAAPSLCRTERFLDDDPGLRALLIAGTLPAIAGVLLGEEARLYKEKLNHKLPGGGGFAPHQDAVAYPNVSRSITCLIAADAMTSANGCLEFAPGRYDSLLPTDAAGCIVPEVARSLRWRPVPVAAGAVMFFNSFVPHRSGPNRTPAPRRAFYLTYNPASEGDLRERYYAMRDAGLAATEPAGAPVRISLIGHFQGEPV
ncbi:MAG TPA: phytanoyl-CoA dioxygenase family protein [Stellaceae bacterium]|nr:phytanoyl-CoA dioxygenase family protein [Stellaceae bacterium]